jgi:hypothetical protein
VYVVEVLKSSIGTSFRTHLETLANLSSKLSEDVDRIGGITEDLGGCVSGFNNVGEYIGEQIKEAAEQMHKTIEALQVDIDQISKSAAGVPTRNTAQHPMLTPSCIDPLSYAQIIQWHLPATHMSMLAHSNERQCQILIECARHA